jgi:hypothetical protein
MDGDREVAFLPRDVLNLGERQKLYIDVPADLDQFR